MNTRFSPLSRFRFSGVILLLALLLVGLASANAMPQLPGNSSRTFPETGKTVKGVFLDYWDTHGGLAQQGYPISEALEEKSDLDGKTYTIQYFERAVFEYHPENQPPYNVLLSQLGTFQYKQKYPNGAPDQHPNTSSTAITFPETGKHVGGIFLDYWKAHGGLAQQGYPISEEFQEKSSLDGKTYTVQYFERAVFESHPENQPPYNVLLSQLGTFRYGAKYSQPGATLTAITTAIPSDKPPARAGHAMVYSNKLKMVLVVNGGDESHVGEGRPTVVWGWDGKVWRVVSTDGPPYRSLGGVAYDSRRDVLVMYGGGKANPSRYYDDTWEWDGEHWQQKKVPGPGIRHHVQMVYDPERAQVIAYAGNLESSPTDPSTQTYPQDTWAWDGTSWKQVSTTGPGTRYHYAMDYDSALKKIIMCCGNGTPARSVRDIWGWDGTSWLDLGTGGPAPRTAPAMAFDAKHNQMVLFGGHGGRAYYDDTWVWDSSGWQQVSYGKLAPRPRANHAMAYDPVRGRVVLFGGALDTDEELSDTWEWDGSAWTQALP